MAHTHVISFNLYGGYDPRADMRIHYDPRRSYLNYLRRREGFSPGAIYWSVDESAPVVMCIFEWIIDNVSSPGRERKAEGWPRQSYANLMASICLIIYLRKVSALSNVSVPIKN
jgi:hypothetical protein